MDENDGSPDFADINIDEEGETVADMHNNLKCTIDEEANEFQGADDEQ